MDTFAPIAQAKTQKSLSNFRLIATDMDGTLTQQGKFTSSLFQAFEDLRVANIPVLIVTGRSAGWVSSLVNYLPIVGAIAENGGIFYSGQREESVALSSIPDLVAHRQHLAEVYQSLKAEFPDLQESADNGFRLTDWTFENCNLTPSQLKTLESRCIARGWGFTYSSIQCHIKLASQDKATGLMQVLGKYFSEYTLEQVLTVGDSPNDASLFNAKLFPLSVGVANIWHYASELIYQPAYVTTAAEGEGFCELVQYLLSEPVIAS
ncbi:HAD-IIB family hydrolase [Lyngbya aestuarii]|uniref:HAD-IIB family hydrolase n=1 Tax=Lyngbya aestuarii TaxID=118322 RepID=UPI00403E0420